MIFVWPQIDTESAVTPWRAYDLGVVALTGNGGFELVGVEGHESALELVAADAGGSDEHHRPVEARPRVQFGHLFVGGDFFAVEVVVLCGCIHNLFSSGFGGTPWGFGGLVAPRHR